MKKTLTDIVHAIVGELSASGAPFSAFNVTEEARKHVNKGLLSDFDLPPTIFKGKTVGLVVHNDVRQIMDDLYQSGKLTRTFQGSYYEYQSAIAAQPLNLSPLNTVMTNKMGVMVVIQCSIAKTKNIVSNLDGIIADLDANILVKDLQNKYSLGSMDMINISQMVDDYLSIDVPLASWHGYSNSAQLIDDICSEYGIIAGDPIDAKLKAIMEPLQAAIFPKAATTAVVSVPQAKLPDAAIANKVVKYLNRVGAPRTLKSIHSIVRARGVRARDIAAALAGDTRVKVVQNSN